MQAYDALLARWPVPYEVLDLPSEYGTTRVYASGPPDGPPLVLLHGGGATALVWHSTVGSLAKALRVYAVDQIGAAGKSVHSRRPLRGRSDMMAWLDATVTALGHPAVDLMGHSYGAWLALSYALHAPGRARRLVLLDPTECLTPMRLPYKLRAVPLMLRPGPGTLKGFLRWETRGAALDPAWLAVFLEGTRQKTARIVMPRRPGVEELHGLKAPTLVLVAERTRSQDPVRLAEAARRLPDGEVVILPGATHHTVPTEHAAPIGRAVLEFLAGSAAQRE